MFALLRSRLSFWLTATVLFLAVLLLFNLPNLLVEWLWFDALEHTVVFTTIRFTQVGLFSTFFLGTLLYIGANTYTFSRYLSSQPTSYSEEGQRTLEMGELQIPLSRVYGLLTVATVLTAFFFSSIALTQWDTFLRYWHAEAFGQTEPIFGRDIGFYVFELPFLNLIQNNIASLAFLTTALLGLVYAYTGGFTYYQQFNRMHIQPFALRHLSANLVVLLGAWAWGYYLNRFELLLSSGGLVPGATYTDIAVKHPALWVMIIASLLLIALLLYNLKNQRISLLLFGGGAYFLIHAIGLLILPSLVQQFSVAPNELEVERPYIKNNITLTRQAYGLDKIQEKPFDASPELSRSDVLEHELTLENIRLWDPRLLIQTYRQLQEIRPYYQFYHVDVDRYTLADGKYRQVMLSGRELTQQLPQQSASWLNRHLQFTHGYGLTMNQVAQEGSEGVPNLIIKDLPPVASEGLQVDEAAIYYGEEMPGYKIVNTRAEELDYPKGDQNVYTHYQGQGGVQLDSYWKKLLFAFKQGEFNIVLSDYLTPDSRIQFWNNIDERVRQVAPFLRMDRDPYLVLSGGRLYWIVDAYTTSRHFPYSTADRQRNLNYIRNSVKIVIDAYHGSVDLYALNDDPLLRTYRNAFPGLFKDLEEMPKDLQDHLRYPEELFNVQIDKYNTYHMTTPQVFYNKEDLWTRPRETYAGKQVVMEPYYLLMQLPKENQVQFLLMSPLTPENRDNMIAWMAAKSDAPNYGELVVYKLPKERLIYGPNQIEAKIDQDTEISQQLSLWDQRGSRVVRGNLLAVPIGESFLYVEPVYLIAQGMEIPQLQRVIAAQGDHIVMTRTLEQSLSQLFNLTTAPEAQQVAIADTSRPVTTTQPALPMFTEEARETLERAEEALRQGQWSRFGEELQALRKMLDNPEEWQQEQQE